MPRAKDGCSLCSYTGYRNCRNLSEAEKAVQALAAAYPGRLPFKRRPSGKGKICSVCVEDQGWML
jgi:hypothetical protein